MKLLILLTLSFTAACSTGGYMKTAENVEVSKFMGNWYVLAGRFTFLETDVYNALEQYTWNEGEQRIDIKFTYNKGSFDGVKKSIPQKGWIYDKKTNAHWKVSPLWPLKFDYLIVEVDKDYLWTAIGVPSQKYLWIMARDWKNPEPIILEAIKKLNAKGYDTKNIVRVPQRWPTELSK
jgi:apolipoprotein D and lipocalin family protein